MNKCLKSCAAALLMLPLLALAQVGEAGVTISRIYVDGSGAVAISPAAPFSATTHAQCPSNGGWAGVQPPAPKELVAAILSAKASQSKVDLVISGCAGGWLKIIALYVN